MGKDFSLKVPAPFLWQLALIGVVALELLLFYLSGIKQVHLDVMKYELLTFWACIVFHNLRKKGPFHLYTIFLYTMFIFLYGRVLFDLLGEWDFSYGNLMVDIYMPYQVQFELLLLLILSLLTIHLGYLYCTTGYTEKEIPFRFEPDPALEYWALFFFMLSLPGVFCKYSIELKTILDNGYLAVFDGTLDELEYPFWTAGSGTVFICSYAVFVTTRPSKRKFLLVSSVFFLLNILNMMKGSRSKVFVPLLYVLWLYFSFYKQKQTVSLFKFILLAGVSIFVSQWMVSFRGSGGFDTSELLILFFLQQGVSMLVLGYMIYYKGLFVNTGLPYLLAPLVTFGFGHGQTFENLQKTHMLGDKLTYFLSPEHFYEGRGIGSSFLAEFYDLGLPFFFVMCILTGVVLAVHMKYLKGSRFLFLLSYFFVQNIIFMPRANFFPNMQEVVSGVVFYFIVLWLSRSIGKIRLKRISDDVATTGV
ncbi:MAG: O-antigen polysaccharide polymerase Wzy [Bacteroidaceae bacterium]